MLLRVLWMGQISLISHCFTCLMIYRMPLLLLSGVLRAYFSLFLCVWTSCFRAHSPSQLNTTSNSYFLFTAILTNNNNLLNLYCFLYFSMSKRCKNRTIREMEQELKTREFEKNNLNTIKSFKLEGLQSFLKALKSGGILRWSRRVFHRWSATVHSSTVAHSVQFCPRRVEPVWIVGLEGSCWCVNGKHTVYFR